MSFLSNNILIHRGREYVSQRALPFITGQQEYIPVKGLYLNRHFSGEGNERYVSDMAKLMNKNFNLEAIQAPTRYYYTEALKQGNYDLSVEAYTYISNTNTRVLTGSSYSRPFYDTLFQSRSQGICTMGDIKYHYGGKALFHEKDNGEIVPLFVLVTKPEYVEYIKKCLMLGEDFHPDAVKLLVNSELDITRTYYRLLRPRYRKHIKTVCEKKGIEIITTSDFSEVFKTFEIPKSFTIEGYQESVDKIASKFIESERHIEEAYGRKRLRIEY
jgi:hypothetical protein